MSFSRHSPALLGQAELGAAMRGIGMRLGEVGASVDAEAQIELTLVSAVHDALEGARRMPDFRVLGVVVVWLARHGDRLNVRHLNWLLEQQDLPPRTAAFWAAIGNWQGRQDARFRVLAKLYQGEAIPVVSDAAARVAYRGADARFDGGPLIVPEGLLRERLEDVDTPESLSTSHAVYRARVLYGPTYRADLLTAVQAELDAGRGPPTPVELARRISCAYGTAKQVLDDVRLAGSPRRLVA